MVLEDIFASGFAIGGVPTYALLSGGSLVRTGVALPDTCQSPVAGVVASGSLVFP